MKIQQALLGVGILILASCSSGTKVGEGPDLDSLATEPTAAQIATAFIEADYGFGSSTTGLSSGVGNCPGGGTASFSSVSTNDTFEFEGELSKAGITIVLNEEEYDVKLDGKVNLEVSMADMTATHKLNLSVSGDLGLAIECDLFAENFNDEATAVYSGKCTVRDSKGNQIEGTAKQLKGKMHLTIE